MEKLFLRVVCMNWSVFVWQEFLHDTQSRYAKSAPGWFLHGDFLAHYTSDWCHRASPCIIHFNSLGQLPLLYLFCCVSCYVSLPQRVGIVESSVFRQLHRNYCNEMHRTDFRAVFIIFTDVHGSEWRRSRHCSLHNAELNMRLRTKAGGKVWQSGSNPLSKVPLHNSDIYCNFGWLRKRMTTVSQGQVMR